MISYITTGPPDSRAKPVLFPLRRQIFYFVRDLDIFRHVLKCKNPSRVRLKLPNKSRNGTILQSHFAMDVSVIDEPAVRLEKQRVHDARERMKRAQDGQIWRKVYASRALAKPESAAVFASRRESAAMELKVIHRNC